MKRMFQYLMVGLLLLGGVSALQAEKLVVCVGDSNTQRGYPKILAAELGEGWETLNCGKGGATMLDGKKNFYRQTKAYKKFKESKPDYVVIMLGTNDADPSNWTDEGRKVPVAERFAQLTRELIAEARALPSKPEVFLVTPLPYFNSKNKKPELLERRTAGAATFSKEIVPLLKKIAKEEKAPLIDVYAGMLDQEESCIDGVHYNKKGYTKMSEIIAAAILSYDKKKGK